MTRAVALCYLRKSLVKSGSPEPASPALQRELTGAAAAKLGLTAEYHEDASGHRSGHTQDRPGWQACAARLADGDVAALIVHTWDRAARNTKHLLQIADDCEAAGVRFVSVSDAIDTRTAAGRFQLTIIAGVGEYESNAASERRVATIDYLRRVKGRHYGTPPFGTERVARDGDLVLVPSTKAQPNGTDHAALARAYELYGSGRLSLRWACMQLNTEGWRWRKRDGSLALWSSDALRRTLANHWVYAGYVSVGRSYRDAGHELLRGSHAPLLPESLLAPIASAFAAYVKGRTHRTPLVYPLTGLLYCAACGQRLAGGTSNYTHRYYRHPLPCVTGHRSAYKSDVIETAARAHLQKVYDHIPDGPAYSDRDVLAALVPTSGVSAAEQRRLTAALDRLNNLYVWGKIDAETYNAEESAIRASLAPPPVAAVPADVVALVGLGKIAGRFAPLEFMAAARTVYARIELDGGDLHFIVREWCKAWVK